jgi:hypothetical protein
MTILFCAKRRKTKKEEERRRGERKREKFCCLFVLVLCCCVVLLSSSRYIIIIKNKIRVKKNSLIKPNKLLILFKGEQDARRVLVLVLGFDLNIRFTFCFQK